MNIVTKYRKYSGWRSETFLFSPFLKKYSISKAFGLVADTGGICEKRQLKSTPTSIRLRNKRGGVDSVKNNNSIRFHEIRLFKSIMICIKHRNKRGRDFFTPLLPFSL